MPWWSQNGHGVTRWQLISVAMGFVPVIAVLLYLLTIEHTPLRALHPAQPNQLQQFSCFRKPGALEFLTGIPLPLKINDTAHGAVVDEHHLQQMLARLKTQRFELSSSLDITSQALTACFSGGAYGFYNLPNSKNSQVIFHHEIVATREQLDFATGQTSEMVRLYHSMAPIYREHYRDAAEAAQAARLTFPQRMIMTAMPGIWANSIVDPMRRPWDNLLLLTRRAEEARIGLAALDRELQRSEQIHELFRELVRVFELSRAYIEADAANNKILGFRWIKAKLWSSAPPPSRQKGLDRWFQRQVIRNEILKGLWDGLLASMEEGEEVIVIGAGSRWCQRHRTGF